MTRHRRPNLDRAATKRSLELPRSCSVRNSWDALKAGLLLLSLGCAAGTGDAAKPAIAPLAPDSAEVSAPASPLDPLAPAPVFNSEANSKGSREPANSVLLQIGAERVGGQLWLGAYLTPPPGTHIYWSNPGSTGLPTRAMFIVNDELTLTTEYPGPTRFDAGRGVIGYGYGGPTAVVAQLPAAGAGQSWPAQTGIRVDVSWLSCAAVCRKESQSVRLNLGQALRQHADLELKHQVARIPGAMPSLRILRPTPTQYRIEPEDGSKLVDYFPLNSDPNVAEPTVEPDERTGALLIDFPDARSELNGVVMSHRSGQSYFFQLSTESTSGVKKASP